MRLAIQASSIPREFSLELMFQRRKKRKNHPRHGFRGMLRKLAVGTTSLLSNTNTPEEEENDG